MKSQFLQAMLAVTLLSVSSLAKSQNTSFDVLINLDDVDSSGYFVSSFSPASANLCTTGAAHLNPVLNMEIGKRYKFTYANASNHPFEVMAKDPGFNHTILLSRGATGTFESDASVEWVENQPASPNDFYFTLTPALAAAMSSGGKTPAYQCLIHGLDMSNTINLAQSRVGNWDEYDK
jgi:hypothetical protein